MTLHELLGAVREQYLGHFRNTIREKQPGFWSKRKDFAVEVLLKIGDGTNPHGSRFNLPIAVDIIRGEAKKPEIFAVEDNRVVDFKLFATTFNDDYVVKMAPFQWNHCDIICDGPVDDWRECLEWFENWTSARESQATDDFGMHGIIHEMTEPQLTEMGIAFTVDLGSAPIDAFVDLIEALRRQGMQNVQVGTFYNR